MSVWSKIFSNWTWHNKDTARDTPLSAQNMQKLNDAIDTIDTRVVDLHENPPTPNLLNAVTVLGDMLFKNSASDTMSPVKASKNGIEVTGTSTTPTLAKFMQYGVAGNKVEISTDGHITAVGSIASTGGDVTAGTGNNQVSLVGVNALANGINANVGTNYSSQYSLDARVTTLEQGGGGGGHYVENEETTGDYVTVLSGRLRLYGSQTTSQAPGTIELESYGDTTIKSDSGSVDIKVGSSGGRILLGANLNNIYKPTHFQNEMHVYYQATDAQYHVNYGTTFKVNSDGVTIKDWYGTSETAMRIKGREIHTIDKVHIKTEYNSSTSSNTGGNLEVDGIITVNGSDYAEKFESIEDCPVGRFVTLDGEKIRLAQPGDDYILGVTSENPAIIGDKDNPGAPVGLVGKLWVESDGTCKVNGFAVSGADGIATDGGSTGYRVMAVDGNRVKILVK